MCGSIVILISIILMNIYLNMQKLRFLRRTIQFYSRPDRYTESEKFVSWSKGMKNNITSPNILNIGTMGQKIFFEPKICIAKNVVNGIALIWVFKK